LPHSEENIKVAVRIRSIPTLSNTSTGSIPNRLPALPQRSPSLVASKNKPVLPSTPASNSAASSSPSTSVAAVSSTTSNPPTPCITVEPPASPIHQTSNTIVIQDPTGKKESKSFSFDAVFPPEADQECVYDSVVRPLISKCLEGYNGCIFAYGQTASGKTYTMTGPTNELFSSTSVIENDEAKGGSLATGANPKDFGIILRAAQQIAEHVKSVQGMTDESGNVMECVVKASYMEIYNETITDLLTSKELQQRPGDLKIKIDPDSISGKELYVQGLTEHYINNMNDYVKLIKLGMKNRTGVCFESIPSCCMHLYF
jgi:hypothetical protein